MFCRNCGSEIAEGTAFCNNCGASVTPAYADAPVANGPYGNRAAGAAYVGEVEDPGKKLGTISLVLGIIGLALGSICSCLFACLGGFLPLATAVVGFVLANQAKNKSQAAGFENKSAKIGMILSIVAIVIIVVFIILNAILGGVMATL